MPEKVMSKRGSTRGAVAARAQRVTTKLHKNSSPSSNGENAAATTCGGTARTDHNTHSQTQAVLSTATAGGSSSSSIQFERFKFGPVLRDEVYRDVFGQ